MRTSAGCYDLCLACLSQINSMQIVSDISLTTGAKCSFVTLSAVTTYAVALCLILPACEPAIWCWPRIHGSGPSKHANGRALGRKVTQLDRRDDHGLHMALAAARFQAHPHRAETKAPRTP